MRVNDHDFRSAAVGIAVSCGIHDLHANRGALGVGRSHDTPNFAVDCLERWWRSEGKPRCPGANELAILADGGGSTNCATGRAWNRVPVRPVPTAA